MKRKKLLQNRQVTKKANIVRENDTSKPTKLKENENKNDKEEENEDLAEECPECGKIFNYNSRDENLQKVSEHWYDQHDDVNDKTNKKDDKLEDSNDKTNKKDDKLEDSNDKTNKTDDKPEENEDKLKENKYNHNEKVDESHMDKEDEIIERGKNNDDENHKVTNVDNDNMENDKQDSHDEEEKETERKQMNKNIENYDELPNHEKPKNDLKMKEKICELCSEEFEKRSMKLVHMKKHITSTTQSMDHPLVSSLRPKTVRIWRKRLDKWKKSPPMLTPSQIRKRKLKRLGTSIHEVEVVTIKTKRGITTKVIHKIRAEKLQHRRKPKENRKEILKKTETTNVNDDCIDETEAKRKKQTEKTGRKQNEDKCCPLFIKEETEVINGKTVKTAIVLNPNFHGKSKTEFCDKHKEDVNEMHEYNWSAFHAVVSMIELKTITTNPEFLKTISKETRVTHYEQKQNKIKNKQKTNTKDENEKEGTKKETDKQKHWKHAARRHLAKVLWSIFQKTTKQNIYDDKLVLSRILTIFFLTWKQEHGPCQFTVIAQMIRQFIKKTDRDNRRSVFGKEKIETQRSRIEDAITKCCENKRNEPDIYNILPKPDRKWEKSEWKELTKENVPCVAEDKCWNKMRVPNEFWGPKNTKLSQLNMHQQEAYFACYFAQARKYNKTNCKKTKQKSKKVA